MDLGFIGTGSITTAVVTAIAKDGHRIVVSERGATHSARLAQQFDTVRVADNQGVVDGSDVVFVGLLAAHAPEILTGLRFRAGQRVISFIAELPLGDIAAMIAPAEATAIMLPFPAIAQGSSPILTLGDASLVRQIFCPANTVFVLQNTTELDVYLCAQAVLSPTIALVASTASWLENQGIDRKTGETFLRALVASNLQAGDCATTLAALATPGGYNLGLRQTFERAGLNEVLVNGLNALRDAAKGDGP